MPDGAILRVCVDARWLRPDLSGVTVYTRELIRHLAARDSGDEYVLLFDTREMLERTVDQLGLGRRRNVTSALFPHGVYTVRSQLALPAFLHRQGVNVYHAPDHLVPFGAFRYARAGRIACVATVHDIIPILMPQASPRSRKRKLLGVYRLTLRELMRRAAAIITDSYASRRDIVRALGLSRSEAARIRVVYCGVADMFRPKRLATSDISRRSEKTVLYVGRPDPYKGVVRLVDACSRLPKLVGCPVRLRIVGAADPRYTQAREVAAAMNMLGSIDFCGHLSDADLVRAYQQADVLVLPSEYEGFGLPVVEAMACGTPVVCSRGGALPEVGGDAVVYVEPLDSDALASSIARVLLDDRLRHTMVAHGIAQARRFTWTRTAVQIGAVYRSVAQDREQRS